MIYFLQTNGPTASKYLYISLLMQMIDLRFAKCLNTTLILIYWNKINVICVKLAFFQCANI